jgi:hypothetical protein
MSAAPDQAKQAKKKTAPLGPFFYGFVTAETRRTQRLSSVAAWMKRSIIRESNRVYRKLPCILPFGPAEAASTQAITSYGY